MNYLSVSELALQFWDRETAITMVAIARGESSFNPDAGGDSPALLESLGHYYTASLAREWNCPTGTEHGPASWGLWQIFLGANHEAVTALSGLTDPCDMAAWLRDPYNNAVAADAILRSQGYGAWAVYNSGWYLDFMDDAEAAVDEVLKEDGEPDPPPPITASGMSGFVMFSIFAGGVYGIYRLVEGAR